MAPFLAAHNNQLLLFMMQTAPIGIFDSGVGGLSVYQKIRELLPCEDLLYVADSLHAPYGSKSADFVRARSETITRFLLQQGAKAIVVACNTATAVSVASLRSQFAMPIIGIEPAVKPAAEESSSKVIGVLATAGTLVSDKFTRLIEQHGHQVTVINQPCDGLAEQVEKGALSSPETEALLRRYLFPLLEQGADTIALGCTHYPFLMECIQNLVGPNIRVIETGTAVANELKRQLHAESLLSPKPSEGVSRFWSSNAGSSGSCHQEIMSKLLGSEISVVCLPEALS